MNEQRFDDQMDLKKLDGSYQVPFDDGMVVANRDNLVGAGPAHAGHEVRVLGLFQVRSLEPHDSPSMRVFAEIMFSKVDTEKSS